MNFQTCVTLGLLTAVLVIPHTVSSQNSSNETTTARPNFGATTTENPKACNVQAGGLVGTLGQLGNLLGNLLDNFGPVKSRVLTNPNGLMDLVGILEQVQCFLKMLLTELGLGIVDYDQANDLLANLVNLLTALLNNLLGGDAGDEMRCQTPAGWTSGPGGPLGLTINELGTDLFLIPLVEELLTQVGALINMFGVPNFVF